MLRRLKNGQEFCGIGVCGRVWSWHNLNDDRGHRTQRLIVFMLSCSVFRDAAGASSSSSSAAGIQFRCTGDELLKLVLWGPRGRNPFLPRTEAELSEDQKEALAFYRSTVKKDPYHPYGIGCYGACLAFEAVLESPGCSLQWAGRRTCSG